MKQVIIVTAAALALAGCSSSDEKLCKAEFGKSLLNPETAKYSDFQSVTQQEIKGSELLSGLREYMTPLIPPAGATYFKMKVRAQGELGNEITKWQFCSINAAKSGCACLPAS